MNKIEQIDQIGPNKTEVSSIGQQFDPLKCMLNKSLYNLKVMIFEIS